MLIKEALDLANLNLKQKGVDSNRIDALLLLMHATSFSREKIVFDPNLELSKEQEERFLALLKRRENREPMSHILEKREFYGSDFFVSSDVLDPRPDSESLIESVLETFPDKNFPLKILELGIGSGCLISTIIKHFPNASGTGVDISDKAILIAQKNIDSLDISSRVKLIKSDWFSNLDSQKFDLIISNPPYIKTQDINLLQDEVKNFEPHLALDGGNSGLDCYKTIARNVNEFLIEKGFLILEIGQNQEKDVIRIFEDVGLKFVEYKKDLGGIIRCLIFVKTN